MASTNRKKQIVRYQTYVEGNTVRKEAVYEQDYYERERKHRDRRHELEAQKKERAISIINNIKYAVFLMGMLTVLLFGSVKYLQTQANLTHTVRRINQKESTLNTLKAENDAEYNRMELSMDLEAIRVKAIEELGMVYADQSQVVLYESKKTDYVRQYQDIPEDTVSKNKMAVLFAK